MIVKLAIGSLLLLAAVTGRVWHLMAAHLGRAILAVWDFLHHHPRLGAQTQSWQLPLHSVFSLSAVLFVVGVDGF